MQRDEGPVLDRFRNRLMIPIYRDNGAIVAFGGRAMDAGQQPKYLNSPETAIYVKGRTLYGLNLGKAAIAPAKYAVMVEGYFDFAQAFQAGITNVVASSGTALTPAQARLLKRFARKSSSASIPTPPGRGRRPARRNCWSPKGSRSTWPCCRRGMIPIISFGSMAAAAYQEKLRTSRPYLEYLLDRSAAEHDLSKDDSRREFLKRCWPSRPGSLMRPGVTSLQTGSLTKHKLQKR